MSVFFYVLFFTGIFLMVGGTFRAIRAHSFIVSLHFLGISDTVGLCFLVVAAFVGELLTLMEMFAIIGILIISGPLVTHIIARAYLSSRRK